jgi:circadian clock protein KaiC
VQAKPVKAVDFSGLHFVINGARQGEPGVIATLEENPTQLERVLAGFGWSLHEPNVAVMYRSPVDIYIDEWVYDLMDTVERTKARRVLIDSPADLRLAAGDEIRFHEFIYSIVQRFSRRGVSVLMTMETPRLYGTDRVSDSAVSPLADNVVMLSYHREGDPTVRKFVIKQQGGIVLEEPTESAAAVQAVQDQY